MLGWWCILWQWASAAFVGGKKGYEACGRMAEWRSSGGKGRLVNACVSAGRHCIILRGFRSNIPRLHHYPHRFAPAHLHPYHHMLSR